MAMYPNATRGYMPFVTPVNKRTTKHGKHCKHACSHSHKSKATPDTKTYRVTLRDRNGFTYTYIIQADGTKSLPVLCESKVTGPNGFSSSLPNLAEAALTGKRLSLPKEETKEDSAKKGLFTSLLQYIRKRTKSGSSSSSNSKSKRKPKPMVQRKRQRTVSQMSNLDPIQESPEEDSEEDADSYTHDSVSTSSETDSVKEHEP